MAITDIQISEELETNAPSIKYRGNEGPKSPQEMQQMMIASLEEEYAKYRFEMLEQGREPMSLQEFIEQAMAEAQMSEGPILPSPEDPVNPFAPKPTGPVLPDRQMAAYGGIMGLDGRKRYGIGSWFQENIMDPIKKNPEIAAAAALYGLDTFEVPGIPGTGGGKINETIGNIYNNPTVQDILYGKEIKTDKQPSSTNIGKPERSGGIVDSLIKNLIPIAGGAAAGLFTKNTESDTPGLPSDETALQLADLKKSANILDQEQGLAAGLNFLPAVSARKFTPAEMIETYAQSAANGGRIGFKDAGPVLDEQTTEMILDMSNRGMDVPTISTITQTDVNTVNAILSSQNKKAEGGIMDLGGMEKDYRAEGGFVPIGKEEKADDVPARLSVNEFVFTADAVRNAGGGDIDQGARVMENMMKHLEAGGQVSEESQGMAGARDMFAVSERLSEVV